MGTVLLQETRDLARSPPSSEDRPRELNPTAVSASREASSLDTKSAST